MIALAAIAILTASTALTATAATKAPFRLTASPSSIAVGRGTASVLTILANRSTTANASITLSASAARKGVRVVFDDNPLAADDTDITIIADAKTVLGKTKVTITGKSGRTTSKLTISVNVTATMPDYGIPIPGSPSSPPSPQPGLNSAVVTPASVTVATATPNVLTLAQGANGTLLLAPVGAKPGTPVAYDIVGLPVGVLPEFFVNGDTVQIRLTVSAQVVGGTYPLNVRAAQNNAVFSSASVALTVTTPNAVGATTTTPGATTTAPPVSSTTTAPASATPTTTTTAPPVTTTTTTVAAGAGITPPQGQFRLTSQLMAGLGKCLEGNNGQANSVFGFSGVPYMADCGPFSGQGWTATAIFPGTYALQTVLGGGGMCLDGNTGGNALVDRRNHPFFSSCEKSISTSQLWKFVPTTSAGVFQLKTVGTGDDRCMESSNGIPVAANPLFGAAFWSPCGQLSGQLWSFK